MAIDKMTNPAAAAGAYANMAKAATKAPVGGAQAEGMAFKDLLRNSAVETIDTLKKSDRVAADAVIGKADLTDVVEAVTAAESTLQTVVAVRDRLVGAYQDIMRMPI